MKPINSSYDLEMNEFYGVKKENLEDIKDWTQEELVWYEWLQNKLAEERKDDKDENLIRDELTNFMYNVLVYRNMQEPELVDGLYRANKVIRINKLMQQKGGLRPWNLPEIKCAGLYTIHPVWFIDEDRLPENVDFLTPKMLEEMNLPDISIRTRKYITMKYPEQKSFWVFLENTPFVESQLRFNNNWEPVYCMTAKASE